MKASLREEESRLMARLRDRIIEFIYRKATVREKYQGILTFLWGLLFSGAVLFIIFFALVSDKLLSLHSGRPRRQTLSYPYPCLRPESGFGYGLY